MIARILILILLLIAFTANAQVPNNVNGPLRQSGTITTGHCVSWKANNLVQDDGATCGGAPGAVLPIVNGGTNTSSQTTNGIAYFNGTAITTGTSLVYNSGNVGIGTATPTSTLTVNGTFGGTAVIPVANGGAWSNTNVVCGLGDSIMQLNVQYYSALTVTSPSGSSFTKPATAWNNGNPFYSGQQVIVSQTQPSPGESSNLGAPTTWEVATIGTITDPTSTTIPLTGALQNTYSGSTYISFYTTAPQGGWNWNQTAWLIEANARLGWPLNVAGIIGLSGATTQQLLGNVAYFDGAGNTTTQNYITKLFSNNDPITGKKCGYVVVQIGTNNQTNSISETQTKNDLININNQIKAYNAIPIFMLIPPRNDFPLTQAPLRAYNAHINKFIHEQFGGRRDVFIADGFKYEADPTTGYYNTGGNYGLPSGVVLSADNIHPGTQAGTYWYGQALYDTLVNAGFGAANYTTLASGDVFGLSSYRPYYGNASTTANADLMYSATYGSSTEGNMFANSMMVGTTGASQTATGYANINSVGHTPSSGSLGYSLSQPSAVDGNPYLNTYYQTLTASQGSGTDYGYQFDYQQDVVAAASQALSSATYQAGDKVYAQCAFQISPTGVSGANSPRGLVPLVWMIFQNASNGYLYQLEGFPNFVPDTTNDPNAIMWQGVMRTPVAQVPITAAKTLLAVGEIGIGTASFYACEGRKVNSGDQFQ